MWRDSWSAPTTAVSEPTSVLLGATFLVVVDLIGAGTAVEPAELPLSVVTAVFGVPFFIWLLRHRRGTLATMT